MLGRRLGPIVGHFDALPLVGRLGRRLASEARPGKSAGRATSAGRAYLARNAEREGVRATSTGLQYRVLRSGAADAEQPTAASSCECHYRGRLLDGVEFDSMSKQVAQTWPAGSPAVRSAPDHASGCPELQPRPIHRWGRIHAGRPHRACSRHHSAASLGLRADSAHTRHLRPGRVAAWARADACASLSARKVVETGSAPETDTRHTTGTHWRPTVAGLTRPTSGWGRPRS